MTYRIKMMSGDVLNINQEEYQKIVSSNAKGLVFIERLKGSINLSSVETILPEDLVPKKELIEGRLHDGTRVRKHFGQWVDAYNPDVRLDQAYYKELTTDTVMSEEEYQEKQKLLQSPYGEKKDTTTEQINP